jgi:hypothetical protein
MRSRSIRNEANNAADETTTCPTEFLGDVEAGFDTVSAVDIMDDTAVNSETLSEGVLWRFQGG